jgi:hypothetical protein
MSMSAKWGVKIVACALAAAGFVGAAAPSASALPVEVAVYTYYNAEKQVIGQNGDSCTGGIFRWGSAAGDGQYTKRMLLPCVVGRGVESESCYFIGLNGQGAWSIQPISCTQLPGF